MPPRREAESKFLFDLAATGPDFRFEREARKAGYRIVAGADEAGRGPLAGPVVAAAVILDPACVPQGLNDSKKLTAPRREALFVEIMACATVSIASSGPARIDATDIRKASLDAMRRAIGGLAIKPDFGLFDGRDVPEGLLCLGRAIVKGDALSLSIAAASIVAKVTRDRMMANAARFHPAYGFDGHAGYGTAQHLLAIEAHGPCTLHRMSFRPLRKD